MPSSLKGRPKTYLVGEFGGSIDRFEHEPLSKGCWTLQERLLSPRTPHYSPIEIFWECEACVLAEDGAFLRRTFLIFSQLLKSRKSSMDASQAADEATNGIMWPDPLL